MLAYREKDNLIHRLHPITSLVLIGTIFFLSLIFSHPAFLVGLFLAVGLIILSADHFREWLVYLKFSVFMIFLIIIINGFFVRAGTTVLISGPRLPVFGKVKITLEALAFGAGMGLRLLVIISVFCLYTYAVNPDKALKLFSRWGNKSVMVITLATRLFPLMARDFRRITEVQRCRGVRFDTENWWVRVKNSLPVISVMLLSCLERALQLAESMYARGYGCGTRSCYSRDYWCPRDFLVLSAVFMALLVAIWALVHGWAGYDYYPKMAKWDSREMEASLMIFLLLVLPAGLSWGWKKWPWLRSKI